MKLEKFKNIEIIESLDNLTPIEEGDKSSIQKIKVHL